MQVQLVTNVMMPIYFYIDLKKLISCRFIYTQKAILAHGCKQQQFIYITGAAAL